MCQTVANLDVDAACKRAGVRREELEKAAGLCEGDTVRMTSPHGSVQLPLKIDASMQRGYLFAPIHFSESNLSSLMSAVPIDSKARMPALKVVPVKLQQEH